MASTDARPIPKKNTAYRVYFAILDADGDPVSSATGLDSEISGDGGTMADCTNEAIYITSSAGAYYLDLTSGEMNYDAVYIEVKSSSSGAKTTPIILYPEEAGDIRVDVTMISGDATAADNSESFFDGNGYAGTGNVIPLVTTTTTATNVTTVNGLAANVITAASIAADAIGASELAADAVTEIQSGLATAANLATVAGYLDTEVAAILADTNELQADLANGGRLDLLIDAIKAKTDTIPTDPAETSDIPTAGAIADAVWEEIVADHSGVSGSTAEALNAAGAAGDPWTTALPGAYGAGSAGKIIGDNVNATISSRASQTSVDDLPTNAELATSQAAADDATLAAISGLTIPDANDIADAVLSRSVTNVEDTADVASLAALILATFESSVNGTVWTIRKTTGSNFVVKTVTIDTDAEPITGVD